ncbi:thiamine pyrophosphate-binding protein [Aquabacter spiritensis]|uniref:Acetolactate synthase-1/2/3 large subunit n=1 Tax=Aquabacter spiritensis TaxID=933073 RepID=A0A4V2UXK6_9HYPH|nr:thiamine pyrophosphate-binding protein [Aquabacter spiritensis]TCT03888.1 acetolactate synthase-1/2/3 large subunit [Aquabacter spiritensis]
MTQHVELQAASGPEVLSITGGEAIARMFIAFGGGVCFGMGGFQLLPFYDAARRLGLRHVLINDERAGIFAADAYAKVSGRVGLCDATLGPGATNLVTGLMEALNAGTPMVVLAGDTHRAHSWKNMTQECRQVDLLRPVCKELIRVEMVSRIPELVRRAFTVATSGRPGPVVIDIPEDISHAVYPFPVSAFEVDPIFARIPALRTRPDGESVAKAADLIAAAKAPVILAGGGVHISGAAETLTAFARALNIPVAHTLSGKGAIPCADALNAGLFGRYDRIANPLIEEADLLIVVGCKLGEIATKRYTIPSPGKTLIHLDCVAEEFDRTVPAAVKLWGDAKLGLADLGAALAPQAGGLAARWADRPADISARMAAWREKVGERLNSTETPVDIARLLTEINAILPENGYLIADGGFAAHWGGLLFNSPRAGRAFVPDRGSASIGYGLPGAMGAALAMPEAPVFALTGDGGFNMMLGELETARRLKLDFTVIVINNAASGYVKALQHLMYGQGAYQSSDLSEIDYAAVANAMGCRGIRVERPEDLAGALGASLERCGGPTVLDVVVTRDPSKMLPGVDSRTVQIKPGDRIA